MVEKFGRSGKSSINVCQQYMIRMYQNILGLMRTWCNSNIIRNFVDFSSVIFWAQNVLISQNILGPKYHRRKIDKISQKEN